MRIAFITDKSAPYFIGGYENRVFELAQRLASRHEVRVFTSLERPDDVVRGVHFERVCPPTFQREVSGGRSLSHSSLFAMALSPAPLFAFSPDVVVVEAVPYAHLVTMRRWIRRLGSVVFLDVVEAWHEYSYTQLPGLNTLSRMTIRFCLSSGLSWADGVLAISRATANSLVQNYGADSSRISLIPLGLTEPSPPQDSATDVHDKEFDVITIGRLVASKRTSDVVAALGALKEKMGWAGRAVIVGSGPQRSALAAQISQLGLDRQIRLAGFVTDDEKRRLLRQSRVYVLASEREGFSLATLEAMGQAVPPIVARPLQAEVFGAADFVEDQRNGLYYPVGDFKALADRLETVLTQAHTERQLAHAAAATAATYSWDSLAIRMEGAMRRVRATVPSGS